MCSEFLDDRDLLDGFQTLGRANRKEAELIDKSWQIRQPRGGFLKRASRVFSSPCCDRPGECSVGVEAGKSIRG